MARLTVSSTSGAVGTTMNGVVNLGCTYAMGAEATNQPILSSLPTLKEVVQSSRVVVRMYFVKK